MASKKHAIALAGRGPVVGLRIGADTVCDRATVNARSFHNLPQLDPDLDAVGFRRIPNAKLIRQPDTPVGARGTRVTEIPVDAHNSDDRTQQTLDRRIDIEDGYRATNGVLSAYRNTTGDVTVAKLQAVGNDAA